MFSFEELQKVKGWQMTIFLKRVCTLSNLITVYDLQLCSVSQGKSTVCVIFSNRGVDFEWRQPPTWRKHIISFSTNELRLKSRTSSYSASIIIFRQTYRVYLQLLTSVICAVCSMCILILGDRISIIRKYYIKLWLCNENAPVGLVTTVLTPLDLEKAEWGLVVASLLGSI